MHRGWCGLPEIVAMNLEDLGLGEGHAGPLCVIRCPPLADALQQRPVLCLPLMQRLAGLLIALPASLSVEAASLSSSPGQTIIGPLKLVELSLAEEGDDGEDALTDKVVSVLLLDLEEDALTFMSLFDPVADSGLAESFEATAPHMIPSGPAALEKAREWTSGEHTPRLTYYSAQEDGAEPPPAPAEVAPKRVAKPKRVTTAHLADQMARACERSTVAAGGSPSCCWFRNCTEAKGDRHSASGCHAKRPFVLCLARLLPAARYCNQPARAGPVSACESSGCSGRGDGFVRGFGDSDFERLLQKGKDATGPCKPIRQLLSAGVSKCLSATPSCCLCASKPRGHAFRRPSQFCHLSGKVWGLRPGKGIGAGHASAGFHRGLPVAKRRCWCSGAFRFGSGLHRASCARWKLVRRISPLPPGGAGSPSLCSKTSVIRKPTACFHAPGVSLLGINDPCLCERGRPPIPTPPGCSKAAAFREAARSGGRGGHSSRPEKASQVSSQTKGRINPDIYQPSHVLPRCPSDVSKLPAPLKDEQVEHKASQAGADQGNGPVNYLRESPLSFTAWAGMLHLRVVATRTPFASFFKRTLHLSRCGLQPPAGVLLPLPAPYIGIFLSHASSGSRHRWKVACRRLLHALVMSPCRLISFIMTALTCLLNSLGGLRMQPRPDA